MRSIILLNKEKKKSLTLPVFLEFVELRTKVASVFPMTIAIIWSIYRYKQFSWLNSLLFALAVLSFDMCTTAINNTVDFYKAKDKTYQEEENVIGKFGLDLEQMIRLVFGLLIFSIFFSLILVFQTDWLLLPLGAICFLIGIFYTFGPIPLSRMPLGEIFSGLTMGFGIFFLAIYIQNPTQILRLVIAGQWVKLEFAWQVLLEIIFLSLPLVALIANIMLANNICDLETDVRNHRYTLVYYIGKKMALQLYSFLASLPWIFWFAYCMLGFLPSWGLLALFGIVPAYKSLKTFLGRQVKSQTFIEAVKSFVLFSTLYLFILIFALLLG